MVGVPRAAEGWWEDGHGILSQAAIQALPEETPAFLRAAPAAVAHSSYDPDLFKNRAAPQLYDAEHPEHYYDPELISEAELPSTRFEFVQLCVTAGVEPQNVGFLPYAVVEGTQRLMIAFAEHRRWPANQMIQQKVLVYAGLLAHYAEDLVQPLHATVHFDGRLQPDGSKVNQGIHEAVDGLIQAMQFDPEELAQGVSPTHFSQLMPAVVAQIEDSRSQIHRTYELSSKFSLTTDPQVRAFATERARAATRFTASLILTAWRGSADVELPSWHRR